MTPSELIVWLHVGSTCMMTGLIWFVQVVHYPLFARVGRDAFDRYERHHQQRTTLVVAPLMLCELTTGLVLALNAPEGAPGWTAPVGLALIAAIWVSTAAIQVPLHRRLERGWRDRDHRLLVSTNWLRTLLWSARVPIVFLLLG